MTNEEVVTAFLREWDTPKPDPEKLAAYFTDDAVYHNMPLPEPVRGRDNIQATFAGILGAVESRGWEVVRQVAAGNIVMNERLDRFAAGEKKVELAVAGVFEVRDGKIAAWRDYFDMGTWTKALS